MSRLDEIRERSALVVVRVVARPAPKPRRAPVHRVAGSCSQCHQRPAAPGYKRCARCVRASKALDDRNRARGLCACGKAPVKGTAACASCAAGNDRRRARLIAAGICLWGQTHGPVVPGRKFCATCLELARTRMAARRAADRRAA